MVRLGLEPVPHCGCLAAEAVRVDVGIARAFSWRLCSSLTALAKDTEDPRIRYFLWIVWDRTPPYGGSVRM